MAGRLLTNYAVRSVTIFPNCINCCLSYLFPTAIIIVI